MASAKNFLVITVSFILGAVGGAGLNERLGIGETGTAILFGFAGLILGFSIARLISKRQAASRKLTPVITRIIKPKEGIHPPRIIAGHRYQKG